MKPPHSLHGKALCMLAIAASTFFLSPAYSQDDIVRFVTGAGNVDIRLFNTATPLSTQRFLDLIDDDSFDNVIIQRNTPEFVIQGGAFRFDDTGFIQSPVPSPVLNEPGLTNSRGTLAFARLGGVVNSATNQFFVNLSDNPGLDNVDEGFTVFGTVLSGIEIIDLIGSLPIADLVGIGPLDGNFQETPIAGFPDIDGDGDITLLDTGGEPLGEALSFGNFVALDITRTTFDTSDFDRDGVVAGSDFDVFASQFGSSLLISDSPLIPPLPGETPPVEAFDADATGDAVVNVADFALFRDSLSSPASVVVSAVGVPEPTSAAVLLAGVTMLSGARPRRRLSA